MTYYFETAVAVLIGMIIWNIWLLTHIKYGEQIISRLSMQPYKITLVLLSSILIENCVYVIIQNLTDSDVVHFLSSNTPVRKIFSIVLYIKICSI